MAKILLLGDEAIAQAAIDAGISGIYAYPGTPSTEIMEYVQASREAIEKKIHSIWSSNEKTAMEAALGMSYAGKRSLVCMKHVGLNVAADPFMNSAITGVNGGLLLVVADDPSMHSSQNEQDSRFYGKFAMIPVLEPSDQQMAYGMVHYGLKLSEERGLPVMLRITTRLAHSRAGVETGEKKHQNALRIPDNSNQFILLPANARKRYNSLVSMQVEIQKDSAQSGYNKLIPGTDQSRGIIACGLAYNYYREAELKYGLSWPVLRIAQYPVPDELLRELAEQCQEFLVLEEGYPMVEEYLRGCFNNSIKIKGRLDQSLSRTGELNPDEVFKALGFKKENLKSIPGIVSPRPPALCKGCSHSDMYVALNEALEKYSSGRVFSDIGCYTLGALPPYNSINTCVDMGASITMAKGAADAGLIPAVAVIGDSTFTHSGMTGLLDAVIENSPVTIIISDNSTTGMTGGQDSSATGRLESICRGIGVHPDHVITIEPLKKNHALNRNIIEKELEYPGVSVIISARECIQTAVRKKKTQGAHPSTESNEPKEN